MLNLYIGKLKPLLTQDKWMPAAVRRAIHEAADELWADVMLELPHGINKILDYQAWIRVRVGGRVGVRVGVRVGASSRRSSCSAGDPYSYFYTYP